MNIAIISFQENTEIIGAKYIHAYLRSQNHKSYLVLQCKKDPGSDVAILKFIADNHIEVVGISLMSCDFFRASQFAEQFKTSFSNIPLVLGGIHATIAPEECLAIGDFAIRGEGEHTFIELLRCLEEKKDYSGLEGICFKENGKIRINPPRKLEENIDIFPFPKHLSYNWFVVDRKEVRRMDLKLFRSYSRYNGKFPNIITTRGCPFSCTYCCNSALKELYVRYPVRKRTVESVIKEIVEIITEHKDCYSLNIQDDCFLTYNIEWIQEFAREYHAKVHLPFVIRTTPSHITKENLTLLKEAGLMMIMMGLQTGSERINREVYKRYVPTETFMKAAFMVKDFGLAAYYDVILDNPYETDEDIIKTLDVILQIPKPFQFELFSLCFYQGTELHKRAVEEGLLFTDPKTDNYTRITLTVFNKIICMTPTLPRAVIKYFIRKRKNRVVRGLISFSMAFNTVFLMPVSFLKIMHRAYGSNVFFTLKLIRNFGKTALLRIFYKENK
jgi:anaerobic magnesium-protoporphyrin IX monomethyl ester cyclase